LAQRLAYCARHLQVIEGIDKLRRTNTYVLTDPTTSPSVNALSKAREVPPIDLPLWSPPSFRVHTRLTGTAFGANDFLTIADIL
jgi:hypothetical protein